MKPTHKITLYVGLTDKNGYDITQEFARSTINRALDSVTEGYNVTSGVGYWMGTPEQCLIVSFLNLSDAGTREIERVAERIRTALDQEAVLIEYCPVSYVMVTDTT